MLIKKQQLKNYTIFEQKKRLIGLFSYQLSLLDLFIFFAVAALIGMSKTGIHGAALLAVTLLALVFGGKTSSGIILPIQILADVFGVWYYRRHASWNYLKRLFPWAALGIILGALIGEDLDEQTFRLFMCVVIFISIALMLYLESKNKKILHSFWFSAIMGIAGGLTSMVGNLAASVMAVYFLSMRLPKNSYISTTAWFFLVINWFKVPFHVFSWHTITVNTVLIGFTTIPFIMIGALIGIYIVKKLPEVIYRWFIIATTLVAAVFLLV